MGSQFNFKSYSNVPPGESTDAKPPGNSPLARQGSVYSLTFDEFQNTWVAGEGKDLGSMNMDELLKNIWSAEETQAMTSSVVGVGDRSVSSANLQRQGSLTLPRTLSQRTVDAVWKDLVKESSGGVRDGNNTGSDMPQRQPTLGEITLEEFLARAGVVREDNQQIGRPTGGGFFDELSLLSNTNNNNSGLALNFQQPNQTNGIVGTRLVDHTNNLVDAQPSPLAVNVGGMGASQPLRQQHQNQLQQQHQQPLFPKPANVAFASSMQLVNNAPLSSPGVRNSISRIADPSMNNNLVHGGVNIAGLGNAGVTVATRSPANQISSDMMAKGGADRPSISPIPNMYGRGRKSGAGLEKVIERRHRRMIKNRESAARSRARKQAYTLELEEEVAKLKEINEELQTKQTEIMQTQKNEFLETMNRKWGSKRLCLRRTLTGPW
ncbi:bZIP transcription factor TRAB1-like [Mercurialis annua]|uniref:bZIP transcription factor TRAB1-like n=1 Tax=Mercurialis annua TaxID=3986 RepID=UPI00215FD3F3|nr:bZIP transcription factor TRAB1-like [Mercurialis annua]XP_050209799.1 bZIP transcription factor TRAB1-like [Mercurialis annua]